MHLFTIPHFANQTHHSSVHMPHQSISVQGCRHSGFQNKSITTSVISDQLKMRVLVIKSSTVLQRKRAKLSILETFLAVVLDTNIKSVNKVHKSDKTLVMLPLV